MKTYLAPQFNMASRNLNHFPENYYEVYPFLRWAGGKSWLLKDLHSLIPKRFKNYHEPFLGGASIFLFLRSNGLIQKTFFLSDLNDELVNCYHQVRQNVEEVILYLSEYRNTKTVYYRIREKIASNRIEAAARFIYLNRTSFNGIYRVNLKGEYNVPFGFKKYSELFNYDNLRHASKLLKGGDIRACDFEECIKRVTKNDFVFLDPPYTVAHNHNGFIKYNQRIFSLEDQYRLAELIEKIKSKGAFFVLTNAEHFNIREIFSRNPSTTVSRFSVIGGRNAMRGRVNELVFSNAIL